MKGKREMRLFSRVFIFVLFQIIISHIVLAQDDIKQLESKLKNAPEEQKLQLLNELAKKNLQAGDNEKVINYSNQALILSRKEKDKKQEATALQYLGNSQENLNNLTKALEYHEMSLQLREEIQDTIGTGKTLNFIGLIHYNWGNYEKALIYYQKSLKVKESLDDKKGMAIILNNIGNVYMKWGKFNIAIDNFQKSLKIFEKIEFKPGVASCYNNIAMVHENYSNFNKALEFYNKGMAIQEESQDIEGIANSLNNIGNVYSKIAGNAKDQKLQKENYIKSVDYYTKALERRKEINDKVGIASSLNNIGTSYLLNFKDYKLALNYFEQAMKINEEINNQYDMVVNLLAITKCNIGLKEYAKAKMFLQRGLEIALRNQIKEFVMQNYETYSDLCEKTGDFKSALSYYKLFKLEGDSIYTAESQKVVTEMQAKYETEKKEQQLKLSNAEVAKKEIENKKQRIIIYGVFGGLGLVIILIIQVFMSLQRKKRDNKIIQLEKEKSEALLLNTLPASVVTELKETGKTVPESFENVSVYFSDICSFTDISAKLEPHITISELNDLFTAFDDIMIKHHCERIKTIGDAYMAVCGMPEKDENHAINIVRAAIEIRKFLEERAATHEIKWRVRIGISSGKVTGGVVGVRKYLYDVFGDTVNTASRMESNSEPMKINTTEFTYNLIKDKFVCLSRGAVEVKGKGVMNMYFIEKEIE
jgi:class 3 adenylate cyclase